MGILDFIRSAEVAGAIPVNGKGDATFVKAMQKFFGLKQDGVISGQNASQKVYRPAITAVKNGKNGSKTVSALQKWSGAPKPYDGIWGKTTSSYMQKKLIALGYLPKSEAIDGICGKKTVKAMQQCLNNNGQPKPQPVPPTPTPGGYTGEYPNVNRGKSLLDMAIKLAWAKGTSESKYRYPSGSATKAFNTGLNKVYPEHKNWGKAPSVGASCDVFVGTVVRYSGLDSKYPRGLEEQFKYKPKNFIRYEYKNIAPSTKMKKDDIVMFDYEGDGAHTVILGDGCYYEANYSTYFGHTNSSTSRLKNKYPLVVILRPRNYLMKGDSNAEVKKLKDYLRWYDPSTKLDDNNVFGSGTEKAVIKMQTDFFGASEADGTVGEKTIAAMKAYRK